MTKQETEAIERNYIEQMFSHYTPNAWDGTLFVINGNRNKVGYKPNSDHRETGAGKLTCT